MKRLFYLLASLSFCTSVLAQNNSLQWSIQAGSGVSTFKADGSFGFDQPSPNTSLGPSFYFGGSASYPIGKNVSLRAGLSFTQLQAKEYSISNIVFVDPISQEIKDIELRDDSKYQFKYLAIPLVAELRSAKAIFHLGFQFMYLGESSVEFRSEFIAPVTFEKTSATNTFNPDFYDDLDIGIRTGYSFKIKPYLAIDLNAYIGLSNIINQDRVFSYIDRRHRQITLGLNYFYL